jgi:hypothetical protein
MSQTVTLTIEINQSIFGNILSGSMVLLCYFNHAS